MREERFGERMVRTFEIDRSGWKTPVSMGRRTEQNRLLIDAVSKSA